MVTQISQNLRMLERIRQNSHRTPELHQEMEGEQCMRKNWGCHGERKNLVLRRKALGALSSYNIFTHFAINLYPVMFQKGWDVASQTLCMQSSLGHPAPRAGILPAQRSP